MLSLYKQQRVVIVLSQKDVKLEPKQNLAFLDIGFYLTLVNSPLRSRIAPLTPASQPKDTNPSPLLKESKEGVDVVLDLADGESGVIYRPEFVPERAVSKEFNLAPGCYAIIPCKIHPLTRSYPIFT